MPKLLLLVNLTAAKNIKKIGKRMKFLLLVHL